MERRDLNDILAAVVLYESSRSIEEFALHVVTKDENADGSDSVRPFPTRAQRPYLWKFVDLVQREQLVLVEKSRQLMLTWAMCVVCLWYAKYNPNRLIFVQSKKEEDAANLVYNGEPANSRISFIEMNLPEDMQTLDFKKGASYGQLRFFHPEGTSKIWAIPEGGDKIRSYTSSLVFSDEYAFQPEAEAAYKAARPAMGKGGKFIGVSSARNGAFMKTLLRRIA